MFNQKIVIPSEFVQSSAEFETTPQETMLYKIQALLLEEFHITGKYRLYKELEALDLAPYKNMNKQQALTHIRNELQTRLPSYTWHILKGADYVSTLLDDVYIWFS